MTNTTQVLETMKAPKALQAGVDGGYILRQIPDVAEGAPVFGADVAVPEAVAAQEVQDTTKVNDTTKKTV